MSKGRGRAERHQREGRKELEDRSKIPVVSWDYLFFGARNRISEAEVEQRGQSPVLVMHDGVTKSIFAHKIPAIGVDFPSCEKVVKMIVKDLDTLGYDRVVFRVFRSYNESSFLALLRAVKLAWTGDVVQETSAEGDPQPNGAQKFQWMSSEGTSDRSSWRWSQLRVWRCQPTTVDVACVMCYQHASSVFGGSRRQDSIRKKCGKARCSPPWLSLVSVCGGCLCS